MEGRKRGIWIAGVMLVVFLFDGVQKCGAFRMVNPTNSMMRIRGRVKGMNTASDPNVKFEEMEGVKLAVVLLNLGGPKDVEDVQEFLFNLFRDPDIIRLPPVVNLFQNRIAKLISSRRAPKSRAAYEAIGGGSPIYEYTKKQAEAIEQDLRNKGVNAKSYIAMRYWHPFTSEAIQNLVEDGAEAMVVLPLYPQFSISTTGSSLRALHKEMKTHEDHFRRMKKTTVPHWFRKEGYLATMASLIDDQIASLDEEARKEGVRVLFSAHGVPKSYVEEGDPYRAHIEECVLKIPQYCTYKEGVEFQLSYQSRVGPVEWLKPYTDDVIEEYGAQGGKNLVVVPLSFVSEHIETLEEIDIEYRELAEKVGIKQWRRVPALNVDERFVSVMTSTVLEAVAQPALSIAEACRLHNFQLESPNFADRISDWLERLEPAEFQVATLGVAFCFMLDLLR